MMRGSVEVHLCFPEVPSFRSLMPHPKKTDGKKKEKCNHCDGTNPWPTVGIPINNVVKKKSKSDLRTFFFFLVIIKNKNTLHLRSKISSKLIFARCV